MPQQNILQTNFSSGELDPRMAGRADTAAYQNGADKLLNCSLLAQGGATRRPGSTWQATVGAAGRCIPFDYDENNRYILVIQNGATKVYDLTGALITTLTTPWDNTMLYDLTFSQLGDIVVICHQQLMPRQIKRVSGTSFTVSIFAFETAPTGLKTYQPYEKYADSTVTITPSSNGGSITLTASASFFVAGHVGTRIRLYGVEVLITAVASGTSATGTVQGTLEGKLITNPFRTRISDTNVEVSHVAHGLVTGQQIYLYGGNSILTASGGNTIAASELGGYKTVTVLDADTYLIPVTTAASGAVDGGGPNVRFQVINMAVRNWDEQVFSAVRGYPRAVCFHEQRLWFAGTPSKPSGMWSSRINRFFNFDVGTGLENESIQVSVGSDQGSAVRHMVSNRHLQVFTGTKDFYCPRQQSQQTLTPGNFVIAAQTPYGTASVRPVPFDGATLFAQANGKTMREFLYSDSDLSYNSNNISLLSAHLINTPVDVAVLQGTSARSEQYAIVVMSDGTLAVFHSARSEKLAGWVPWQLLTGHKVLSVCTVGNTLYWIAQRGSAYYLEKVAADDSLTLDCATAYAQGSPTTSWTVDARYFGQVVRVVSGDLYLGEFTVGAAGQLTLNDAVTSITVGFDYTLRIRDLPPNVPAPQGPQFGDLARIAQILVWLDSSLSMTLEGQRLVLRQVTDAVEVAPARFTGVKRFYNRGYSREPQIEIVQDEPLPFRILALRKTVIA